MRKSAALRPDAEKAQHFGFSQEELEALSWIVCRSLLPLNQSVMNGLWPCLLGTDLLNLYGKLQWAGCDRPARASLGPFVLQLLREGGGWWCIPPCPSPSLRASHPWLSRLSFVATEGCSGCGVLPEGCVGGESLRQGVRKGCSQLQAEQEDGSCSQAASPPCLRPLGRCHRSQPGVPGARRLCPGC